MTLSITRFLMLAVILMAWLPLPSAQQGGLLAAGITLVSPSACPSTGCAAGQRLNYKVEYNLTRIDPTRSPNLQLCFFIPNEWHATLFAATLQGTTTNVAYTLSTSNCGSVPTDYDLLGGVTSTLPSSATSDILPFSFRIGSNAVNPHIILVRIFERDTNNVWQSQTDLTTGTPMNITATASTVFVANDAAACGTNKPCYINSQDDQSTGYGTGLKDAIDAATNPATISVLGDYTIKQKTVLVDKPHTIKSIAPGRITYTDTDPICTQPMLSITAGAKLSGLAIDDGSCTSSPARTLVTVSSPDPVVIETSDLSHGVDAIRVLASNVGNVIARFNQITDNVGYAIYLESSNTGVVNAFGNNLYGNRTGAQVECNGAAKGTVDHNFWGTGVLASEGSSQCTENDNNRLGARVLHIAGIPGVQGQQVTVNASAPQYIFNNMIGFQRNASGNDYGLVIVNHGYGDPLKVPYSIGQIGVDLISCNNFYDIFLADSPAPVSPANLTLFFKYNLNAGCITAVESGQYCNQIVDPTAYPLWWYDLAAHDWKTTGTSDQETVCRMDANKEIRVTIDNNSARHPNFSDLSKLPFTLAIPGGVIISSMLAQPGNGQVSVQWATTQEDNLSGFVVQRSENEDTGFADVSTLITHLGSGGGGSSYQYIDGGRTNYLVYYYRLKVVKTDNSTFLTNAVSVTPFPSTPTITLTRTPSRFPTSTFIFKSNTPTRTFTLTPTSPFKTITNTPRTATSLTQSTSGSLTPRATGSPVATTSDPSTALAQTRALRTELAWLSATPTFTPTPTLVPGQVSGPLTIVLAILAVGTLAGAAIYLIREQAAH